MSEEIQVEVRGSLTIATWPENPSPEAVERYFDRVKQLLDRQIRYAAVLDLRRLRSAPSEVRSAGGRRLKQLEPQLRLYCRGQATVITSPLIRGALAAVYLISPPGYPTKTFNELDPAVRWARAQLGQ